MTTIEAQAQALLDNPVLKEAVRLRTQAGIQKYGQRLEENRQTLSAKAVHLAQEELDALNYSVWMGWTAKAERHAREAEITAAVFGLTLTDIMEGGKQ